MSQTTTPKPQVYHAGCGGRVWVAHVAGEKRIVCILCERVILDVQELTPHASVFVKPTDDLFFTPEL